MAKKVQKTIYIEKDIYTMIEYFQKGNDLSSFSVAIERLLLTIINDTKINNRIKKEEKQQKEIPNSIINIRNSMRD